MACLCTLISTTFLRGGGWKTYTFPHFSWPKCTHFYYSFCYCLRNFFVSWEFAFFVSSYNNSSWGVFLIKFDYFSSVARMETVFVKMLCRPIRNGNKKSGLFQIGDKGKGSSCQVLVSHFSKSLIVCIVFKLKGNYVYFLSWLPEINYSLFSVYSVTSLVFWLPNIFSKASQIIYQFIGIPRPSLALLICH